jgi:hypothetical protein
MSKISEWDVTNVQLSKNEKKTEQDIRLDNLRQTSNTLKRITGKSKEASQYLLAFKSVFNYQTKIDLAYNATKYDLLYIAQKDNNILNVKESDFIYIETTFTKIRDIISVIQLCRACGMTEYEERFLEAMIAEKFEIIPKTDNSSMKELKKILEKYASLVQHEPISPKK